MPEAHVTKVELFELHIQLNRNELNLLKAMVQNALKEDETLEEYQLRLTIFKACSPQIN